MDYDQKLDLILSRLDAIEAKIGTPITIPEPQQGEGGLYWYKRPAAGVPRYGYGVRLTADTVSAQELRLRALYCVQSNGEIARSGPYEDEVWAEIEALKAGDQGLIAKYEALDPDVVGYALLTNQFDTAKHDWDFGININKRRSFAGKTLDSIAEEMRIILGGGAAPGIGGEDR